jgi:RES domain-containing protein
LVTLPENLQLQSVDQTVVRIIPARFPQINLFERVAGPEDWDILYAVESLTNPRLRDEVGDIALVPPGERVFGPGASWIMAAFTHRPKPGQGGRFNAEFGTYYCASEEATAIAETTYHRARFLREARIDHTKIEMRVIRAYLGPTDLHDLCNLDDPAIYHLSDYSAGQLLGAQLQAQQSAGLIYDSVRHPGECCAVFKPSVLTNAVHLKYLTYTFENNTITKVEQTTNPA